MDKSIYAYNIYILYNMTLCMCILKDCLCQKKKKKNTIALLV